MSTSAKSGAGSLHGVKPKIDCIQCRNALPLSRACRTADTFCRGCDFPQCKFLLLFNQLPRSSTISAPKPPLADLLRLHSPRKIARHSPDHDNIGGTVTRRRWTPDYSMFGDKPDKDAGSST